MSQTVEEEALSYRDLNYMREGEPIRSALLLVDGPKRCVFR